MKSLLIDAGKVIPVNYLLAWAESVVPFPKPAGSNAPVAPPAVPTPQNPNGGYYPGAPVLQDPRMQPGNPQSYNDPRTIQQAYYQDPRSTAIQPQQLAYAGVQPSPQDSQPREDFGRAQADLSQMGPQSNWFGQSEG